MKKARSASLSRKVRGGGKTHTNDRLYPNNDSDETDPLLGGNVEEVDKTIRYTYLRRNEIKSASRYPLGYIMLNVEREDVLSYFLNFHSALSS